jgi:hypothetical protein
MPPLYVVAVSAAGWFLSWVFFGAISSVFRIEAIDARSGDASELKEYVLRRHTAWQYFEAAAPLLVILSVILTIFCMWLYKRCHRGESGTATEKRHLKSGDE